MQSSRAMLRLEAPSLCRCNSCLILLILVTFPAMSIGVLVVVSKTHKIIEKPRKRKSGWICSETSLRSTGGWFNIRLEDSRCVPLSSKLGGYDPKSERNARLKTKKRPFSSNNWVGICRNGTFFKGKNGSLLLDILTKSVGGYAPNYPAETGIVPPVKPRSRLFG